MPKVESLADRGTPGKQSDINLVQLTINNDLPIVADRDDRTLDALMVQDLAN